MEGGCLIHFLQQESTSPAETTGLLTGNKLKQIQEAAQQWADLDKEPERGRAQSFLILNLQSQLEKIIAS